MSYWMNNLRLVPLFLLALVLPVSLSASTVAVCLTLASALGVLIWRRDASLLPPRPVLWALAAYILVQFLAGALAAPYPSHWNKCLEENWLKLLLIAVPVLLAGRQEKVGTILRVTLVMTTLVAVYSIGQHFSGFDLMRHCSLMTEWGYSEVVGFFSHKLSYGGQLMLVMLVGISLALEDGFRGWRVLYLPLLGFMGLALMWSYARSAQIGLWAGLLFLLLVLKGWRRWAGLAMLMVPVLVLATVPLVQARFSRLFSMEKNISRLNLWQSSWDALAARPWLGFGPGNFQAMMGRYEVDGFYNSRSHAHDDFLMHGVNAGWLGILVAALLLVVVTVLLWKSHRAGGPLSWVALAAVAAQVAISVAGLFQVYQTDDEVEMMLYFLLGCGLALVPGPDS